MIKTERYVLKDNEVCPVKPSSSSEKPQPVNFGVKIKGMDTKNMEIDFMGLHFSLVNAFRRIVLAEVPTMAIDKVYMFNNTSIMQDEVLSHRLGLVPLNIQPSFFSFQNDSNFSSDNCVKYKLKVLCTKDGNKSSLNEDGDDVQFVSKLVTSANLQWEPHGDQATMFQDSPLLPIEEETPLAAGVKTENTHLVLCKLNPGQKIILDAYAVKGIGSDHAKFQPGLCWYRMLPTIQIKTPIYGDQALQLQKYFSPGVIGIKKNKAGMNEAYVEDARNDSGSRNVFKDETLKDCVTIGREAEHIIFHIESHSALSSCEILETAVQIMIDKCDNLLNSLSRTTTQ